MIIKTLVENRTISENFKPKHGLSLYLETKKHKILFDVGSTSLFLINASKLGVNIKDIDILVISHGHLDHGGALKAFLDNNSKARIYVSRHIFDKHYLEGKDELLDVSLEYYPEYQDRFIYVDDYLEIDEELVLISKALGSIYNPTNNKRLYKKIEGELVNDDFNHEQHLYVRENKNLLICGCCHSGLINVLDRVENLGLPKPDKIISGLHLLDPISKISEDDEFINGLGKELLNRGINLYTCHCTGYDNYLKLKTILRDDINYLATGEIIKL